MLYKPCEERPVKMLRYCSVAVTNYTVVYQTLSRVVSSLSRATVTIICYTRESFKLGQTPISSFGYM